jgi:hypothetical protein
MISFSGSPARQFHLRFFSNLQSQEATELEITEGTEAPDFKNGATKLTEKTEL